LERVKHLQRRGHSQVLDADISGFFDNLPQSVILRGLANVVADGNILRLVQRFLRAGGMEDGVLRSTTVGTPQGGVISPLLANIALNFLDWHLARSGFRFVRYADDFVVLCRSARRAKEALLVVTQKLTELGLHLSPEKTRVTNFREGFAFLGFDFRARSARMRTKTVERFKDKIRQMTVRKHNLDAQVLARLNAVIRGVARYYATSFSTVREQFRYLDAWIRMRVRCMKFQRKSVHDNWRLPLSHLRHMGLAFMMDSLKPRASQVGRAPGNGQSTRGRPVPERGTPVNMRN
jgi:group II intron reverse transcriptase/maturase